MRISYEPLEDLSIVERVKLLCKINNISIAELERNCGFANGYIGKLKEGTMPADRLAKVAEYLNEPVDLLIYGLYDRDEDSILIRNVTKELNKLNNDGREKALEYLRMLSRMPEYQKGQKLLGSNVG